MQATWMETRNNRLNNSLEVPRIPKKLKIRNKVGKKGIAIATTVSSPMDQQSPEIKLPDVKNFAPLDIKEKRKLEESAPKYISNKNLTN